MLSNESLILVIWTMLQSADVSSSGWPDSSKGDWHFSVWNQMVSPRIPGSSQHIGFDLPQVSNHGL